jgi:hypothetical protein
LPWLPVADLGAWLERDRDLDDNARIRSFRAWVRGLRPV